MSHQKIEIAHSSEAVNAACLKILDIILTAGPGECARIAELCDDLSAMQRFALGYAKDMGRVFPTFVLLSKKGAGAMFPVILQEMPRTTERMMEIATPLALLINRAPIDGYFFVAEAWMALYHRHQLHAEDDRLVPDRSPMEREDRRECLITACFRRGEEKRALFEIIRQENGDIRDLILVAAEKIGPVSFYLDRARFNSPQGDDTIH